MLKVVHFADLHLGVENYSHTDPSTGLTTCFSEFLSVFDEVVDFALKWEADLVLFCGDAYKNRDPSQTQQREFARRISSLIAKGIPVFLVVGNHDLPNAIGRATAVEIFDTLAVKRVTVASHPGTFTMETRSGTLQIVALPWIRRSALLSREATKNLSLEKITARLEEELAQALFNQTRQLSNSLPTLLAAHVSVSNAVMGSEKAMMIGQDPVLLQSNISDSVFDYVALGHIHKHQILSYQPPIVYAGSLQRIDFGDEGEEKGFYSVEIDPAKERGDRVVVSFRWVKARRFLTIKTSVSPDDVSPLASVSHQVSRYASQVAGSVVRLLIQLPQGYEDRLPEPELRRMLCGAQYLTIVKETQQEHRPRLSLSATASKMDPGELLQTYLKEKVLQKEVSPEHARILREYGERLIQEDNEPGDSMS